MVRAELYGHTTVAQTSGSYAPVSVTLDNADSTKARLWTLGTGSNYILGTNDAVFNQDGNNSLVTIDQTHHRIHEGKHFFVAGYTTLASGGLVVFTTQTPDSAKRIHMGFNIEGTATTNVKVYEGATISSGTGTLATPINNDRNSSTTSVLNVRFLPTITGSGTLIEAIAFGHTGKFNLAGGAAAREEEIILKQNEIYMWRIESAGDDNIISYKGFWYEV